MSNKIKKMEMSANSFQPVANDGAVAVNLLLQHSRSETLETTEHFFKLRMVLSVV